MIQSFLDYLRDLLLDMLLAKYLHALLVLIIFPMQLKLWVRRIQRVLQYSTRSNTS